MITKKKTWFSKVYIYIILLFLYIPFIPLILFSFNDSKSLTDFTGFSLRWYQKMLEDKDIALAIINTFFIAILATFISTFIGTIASIALSRSRKILRDIVLKINNFPIVNPEIVTAIAMLLLFVSFKIPTGYITMLLAHIAFCTPYVIVTVYPKVKSLDANVIEAAQDLGATPWQAIWKILVPQIKGAVLAAMAIAFTMSFDDFIISYFTSGGVKNISIYLYTTKRRDPSINALSTIITVFISIIVMYNFLKKTDEEKKLKRNGRKLK
ncbi:MAG: ABC transporter permease [Bacilli bacterium]|nr:ABC transporter permease [Bacilli bacterium]MDD4584648.1 ABC transporter permease [Bacilli bacterium]